MSEYVKSVSQHLGHARRWADNAVSMAEHDNDRDQAAAAIFAQVAIASAVASAEAVKEMGDAMNSRSTP